MNHPIDPVIRQRALARSAQLFVDAATMGADGPGVTRAAFGDGETRLLEHLEHVGLELGLRPERDLAGNLYLTLPGRNPELPAILIGSHADSVPQGGNYDGLAGILAGIACVEILQARGEASSRDVTVAAFRGEENAWFGAQHLGSRAALGLLDPTVPGQARRSDSQRTLADHMRDCGLDAEVLLTHSPHLSAERIACFLEVHIEQGPVLLQHGLPVGIVSAIRGNVRCPSARCLGEAGHAGVVPLTLRRDAVVAAAELVGAMQADWLRREAAGEDLVLTFGKFHTDASAHAVTTIPGRVDFAFEARSHTQPVLDAVRQGLLDEADRIATARGVHFEFGTWSASAPVAMDARLRARLHAAFEALDLKPFELPSGAGHDAQDFAIAGIPAAMIFIRNENGSHNPAEAMQLDDFALAVDCLTELVRGESQ